MDLSVEESELRILGSRFKVYYSMFEVWGSEVRGCRFMVWECGCGIWV